MSVAEQINLLVTQLPEKDQTLVLELVQRMAPDPDDVLSAEDLADIEEARREYERGECIPLEAINWK